MPVTHVPAVQDAPPPGSAGARPAGRLRGLFTRSRVISSLLLAIAGGMLVIGFQGAADPAVSVHVRPAGIQAVFPVEGAKSLRQEPLGARLDDGLTGELSVDGVAIPLDQLVRPNDPIGAANTPAARGLAGLNEVSFTPGAGKEIATLAPGAHRASVLFWDRITETRAQARTYEWSFSVT